MASATVEPAPATTAGPATGLTLGEALIHQLRARGVEVVFGIPGVHTLELYRGLAGSGIRHVTPRHEQGAGFMADGYARVTGKPGVCFVITGPGLTNIATAMGQAYADSVPMLVISSVAARPRLGGGTGDLHELTRQAAISAPVTAFTHTLLTPETLPEVLDRAFAVFAGARPRPVHLEIPVDLLAAPAGAVADVPPAAQPLPAAAAAAGLEQAADWAARAERPVMLAGGGCVACADQVRAVAEHLDMPVVQTINGRGVLPLDHPLSVPASPSMAAVRALVAEADLVLAVGTELGPTDFDAYGRGAMPKPVRLVRIDVDPLQLCRGMPADLALSGDAGASLSALATLLQARSGTGAASQGGSSAGARRAAAAMAAARAEVPARMTAEIALMEALRDRLGDVPIVGDSTQLVYATSMIYAAPAPRRYFHSATGFGTLGYGLGGAIGAALGTGGPALCIVGDGGLQFDLGSLGTLKELALPVIVLVWDNQGYGEIKSGMIDSGIAPVGVDLFTPDFVTLAQAYQIEAARVAPGEALVEAVGAAVERLCRAPAPLLLHVPISGAPFAAG